MGWWHNTQAQGKAGDGLISSHCINSTILPVWQKLGASWLGCVHAEEPLIVPQQLSFPSNRCWPLSAPDLPPRTELPGFENKSDSGRRRGPALTGTQTHSPGDKQLESFCLPFLFVRRAWVRNGPTERETGSGEATSRGILFLTTETNPRGLSLCHY